MILPANGARRVRRSSSCWASSALASAASSWAAATSANASARSRPGHGLLLLDVGLHHLDPGHGLRPVKLCELLGLANRRPGPRIEAPDHPIRRRHEVNPPHRLEHRADVVTLGHGQVDRDRLDRGRRGEGLRPPKIRDGRQNPNTRDIP